MTGSASLRREVDVAGPADGRSPARPEVDEAAQWEFRGRSSAAGGDAVLDYGSSPKS